MDQIELFKPLRKIIIVILLFESFFTSALTDGFSLEFK